MKKLSILIFLLLTIPNTFALTLSDVNVPANWITDETAIIKWETDVHSTSKVEYGTTTSYGQVRQRTTKHRSHILDLTNLNPLTTYYYRISSSDGVETQTYTGNFTTEALLPETPLTGGYKNSQIILNGDNKRYVLQGDVYFRDSGYLILGNNVILDLNGYTINYDTYYDSPAVDFSVPNGGFESGSGSIPSSWDLSQAPGTERRLTASGEALFDLYYLNIPNTVGERIVSDWFTLPGSEEMTTYFAQGDGDWEWGGTAVLPSFRVEIEREGTGIIASGANSLKNIKNFEFTTPAGEARYRIIYTLDDIGNGAKNPEIDLVSVMPTHNYGVQTDRRTINAIVRNGKIIQGKGASWMGDALKMIDGQGNVVYDIEASTIGLEASAFNMDYSSDNLLMNCIASATFPSLIGRPDNFATINMARGGNQGMIYDCDSFGGYGHSSVNAGTENGHVVAYNNIRGISQETNHQALYSYGTDELIYHDNVISGNQGIFFGGDLASKNLTISRNKIYDNVIIIDEPHRPNAEYGWFSHDGIKLNDYKKDGCYDNWIDNNTVIINAVRHEDYSYSGGNDFSRDGKQMITGISMACEGTGNVVSNNKVISSTIDDGIWSIGFELGSYFTGGNSYYNNYIKTNHIAISPGGYPTQIKGAILKNFTIEKVNSPYTVLGFRTIYGYRAITHYNENRWIDLNLVNGADFNPENFFFPAFTDYPDESGIFNYPITQYEEYTVKIRVTDLSGNPLSQAVMEIRDGSGNNVFSGLTNGEGIAENIVRVAEHRRESGQGGLTETTYGPFTITISKAGYADYTETVDLNSRKEMNVVLSATGPGVLLHSTLNTLSDIQTPLIYTALMDPLTSAIRTTGTGSIDLVPTNFGGGVQINGQGVNAEELQYDIRNIDFYDLAGDGGRIDFKMKFNEDPKRLPNTFIIKTDSTHPTSPNDRWFVFEILGYRADTNRDAYPWVVMYSEDPDFWVGSNQVSFQAYTGADWSVWQDVDAGEWHQYTIMWRNLGNDYTELHLFIDGKGSKDGCPTCSDYGGWTPPLNSMSKLIWGSQISGDTADIELDEFWSFSRWNHGVETGTFDTSISMTEEVVLLDPDNDELLFTENPTFKFIVSSDIDSSSCIGGTCKCDLYVDGELKRSVNAISEKITEVTLQRVTQNGHSWHVECYDGAITSNTKTFSIDPSAVTNCEPNSPGAACDLTTPEGVICRGQDFCVDNAWQCIIPPGGCDQNGAFDLWIFQNGLYGYIGQEDAFTAVAQRTTPNIDCSGYSSCLLRADARNNFDIERHFFKFDLSQLPTDKLIQKAELVITERGLGSDANGTISLYRVTSDWDASTVTWDTKPTFDASSEISSSIGNLENITLDVTEWVNSWKDGNNFGFFVEQTGSAASVQLTYNDYSPREGRPLLKVQLLQDNSVVIGNPFDLDNNGVVYFEDLVILASDYFGLGYGMTGYKDAYDYNSDSRIDILDLVTHIKNWDQDQGVIQ